METQVLDTNTLMGAKSGLTTIFSLVEYPKAIKHEFEVLWPEKEDFILAIELMAMLYERGKPIPAIDVIISSMCINRMLELKTKDRHFSSIKEIRQDFKVAIRD